jgi:serine/threonine protein kinase
MYTTKSDCWSFGVLLYEIWTRAETPYKDMTNNAVWVQVIAGYRLPCPDLCPTDVYAIMQRCWSSIPEERPSFDEILETLTQLHKAMQPQPPGHTLQSRFSDASLHDYVDFARGSDIAPPQSSRRSSSDTLVAVANPMYHHHHHHRPADAPDAVQLVPLQEEYPAFKSLDEPDFVSDAFA